MTALQNPARIALALIAVMAIASPVVGVRAEPAQAATSRQYYSGASGAGTTDGTFAAWRGKAVGIAGTWSDNNANAAQFWQLRKGGALQNWNKPIDIAVGAIDAGESWKTAATGAYDARWKQSLTLLKKLRSTTSAPTYIRFAHEMNGNWYPWSVNTGNYRYFDAAWKRYRAIQKKVFPTARLVFSVNRESIGTGMSWTKFFPGAKYVDVLSVDYYNQYPYVSTTAQWKKSLDENDAYGAPKGLAQYVRWARVHGLHLAVSEWSGKASNGDSPAFVKNFLSFVKSHAGNQVGQFRYEILFNVGGYSGNYQLFGKDARMPASSAAYRSFFRG